MHLPQVVAANETATRLLFSCNSLFRQVLVIVESGLVSEEQRTSDVAFDSPLAKPVTSAHRQVYWKYLENKGIKIPSIHHLYRGDFQINIIAFNSISSGDSESPPERVVSPPVVSTAAAF